VLSRGAAADGLTTGRWSPGSGTVPAVPAPPARGHRHPAALGGGTRADRRRHGRRL